MMWQAGIGPRALSLTPAHGSHHHASTVALNRQTALQSAFHHFVVPEKKN